MSECIHVFIEDNFLEPGEKSCAYCGISSSDYYKPHAEQEKTCSCGESFTSSSGETLCANCRYLASPEGLLAAAKSSHRKDLEELRDLLHKEYEESQGKYGYKAGLKSVIAKIVTKLSEIDDRGSK